jgi:tagatose 6-phosphate kinase
MILCIGTTPAAQRVMVFRKLTLDTVNRAVTTRDGAAGKAVNVAKVLKTLGEEPVVAGFLGGERGAQLRSLIETEGIALAMVAVAANTRQCITVIDEAAGAQTELVEESGAISHSDFESLMALIAERARNARAMVMSGTVAPGVPADIYLRCTRLAHELGAFSVLDAHGPPLVQALAASPGLVKPNRAELSGMLRVPLQDEESVKSAMKALQARGAQRVVITSGKDPVLAFDGGGFWRISVPTIRAVNPIGSGDAFTAALVWRLLSGDGLGQACRWAVAAGAANALTLMPGELGLPDLNRLVNETRAEMISK